MYLFGRTDGPFLLILPHVLLVVASVIALFTDLRFGKIYNWLTLPLFVLGVAYQTEMRGWEGFGESLLGAGSAFLLLGWIYWLKYMGAGDVKFLMAFSAWGGLSFSVEAALLSILIGGVIAAGILVVRGTFFQFIKNLYRFVRSLLIRQLVVETPPIDRKLTMPFGVPLALASLWTWFFHPLKTAGLLWF